MARSRSMTARLGDVFEDTARPVYILDEQRHVVYCNKTCGEWLAVDPDELIGVRADYHHEPSENPLAKLAAGLCPPPEAFQGTALQCVVGRTSRDDGSLSQRLADVFSMKGKDDNSSILVIVEDKDCDRGVVSGGSDRSNGFHSSHTLKSTITESAALHDELRRLRVQLGAAYRPDQLLGQSMQSKRVREQVRLAISGRSRAVIIGPPGSGREHVARTIHYGAHKDGLVPLLALNCSMVDREMLQTTIRSFAKRGGEPGPRPTTLLLLDVESLPQDTQAELAGFFTLPALDVRVIATARTNLLELAKRQVFRVDLAFALSTLVIELPPLSQRPRDIPLLAQHFLGLFNQSGGKQFSGFVPEAIDLLTSHTWPRNIDELATVVDEACRRSEGPWITTPDLPARIQAATNPAARSRRPDENLKLDDLLTEVEKELVQRAMHRAKGNKAKAARLLGIHRARLLRRLEQLGLAVAPDVIDVPFEPIDPTPPATGR